MREPKNALVVEDHDVTRQAMSRLVSLHGYAVDAVETVAEALLNLDGRSKIILDLRLPDGSGVEVLSVLRETKHPASVAIISGEVGGPMLDAALRLCPNLYLPKPVDTTLVSRWLNED